MDKLLFIYDNLMTKDEQELTELPLEFISLGQMKGKLRWVNDTKKRRLFAIPNKGISTKVIFGAIFLLKEYEHNMHKLHGYYHNSIPLTSHTLSEDLYQPSKTKIRLIRTASIKFLADGDYEVGPEVECDVFIGNVNNKRIQNSLKKRYYEHRNIHAPSYLQMIKENFTTKEE